MVIFPYYNHFGTGIETCYKLDGSMFETQWVQEICCSPLPSILGSTQPLVQWVPGRFWGNKAAGTWLWPPTPM